MPTRRRREDELAREQRRLGRMFSAALVALAPAFAIQACDGSSSQPRSTSGAGGSADAGPDGPGTTIDASAHDAPVADASEAGAQSDVDASLDVAETDAHEAVDAAASDDAPDAPSCTSNIAYMDAGADVDPSCILTFPCGLPAPLVAVGCELYVGPVSFGCTVLPDAGCIADAYIAPESGLVLAECPECPGGHGRVPRGLRSRRSRRARGAATGLGGYFARMAHGEAASVHAFRRMGDELARHAAPASLIRACERAANDERRHARVMARQAIERGASVEPAQVRWWPRRSLEAMARENAVEGCVNEAFGALLLAWQAAHAPRELRGVFARVARDELRHVALAHAVARWASAQLGAPARARVAAAIARALAALEAHAAGPSMEMDAPVGRPDAWRRASFVAVVRESVSA